VVNVGSAIIGGVIVAIAGGIQAHLAHDSKQDIANEINRQLSSDVVKNQISVEIGKQLVPMNDRLVQLSEDIGKIKDNLHIAKADPLPTIGKQLRTLESSSRPTAEAVAVIAKSLRVVDSHTRGYWPTVARLINLQAKVKAGKPLPARIVQFFPTCIDIGTFDKDIKIDLLGNYQCAINLDNVSISDSTISNALVYFSGTVKLSNVRFTNCVFVVSLQKVPTEPAKRLAEELLASAATQSQTFTVNSAPATHS
jgi:anti-anti-sigma regulatory factor